MIFDSFFGGYEVTFRTDTKQDVFISGDEDFDNVISQLGGSTFAGGLYRVFPGSLVEDATSWICSVFPGASGKIVVFGYDWLGRYFAVDSSSVVNGKRQVLMLEPGSGEAFDIPGSILDFHNIQLIEHKESALACTFYEEWRKIDPTPIKPSDCIGYKVPLFLGGKDTVHNLESIDLEVYTCFCGQLRRQTCGLPDGATIRDISTGSNEN